MKVIMVLIGIVICGVSGVIAGMTEDKRALVAVVLAEVGMILVMLNR